MGGGAESTKKNWEVLCRLAKLLFDQLSNSNPDWNFEDLQRHLALPSTNLFRDLAANAGFRQAGTLTAADENLILRAMLRKIFSPEQIARETGLSLPAIRSFLRQVGVPFGGGGYGMFPWPSDSGVSPIASDSEARPRRISKKGQFSYKGQSYYVGTSHARRRCWILEAGNVLVVHLAGKPPLTLHKRGRDG